MLSLTQSDNPNQAEDLNPIDSPQMSWPISISNQFTLPEVKTQAKTAGNNDLKQPQQQLYSQPNPHLDPIITSISPLSNPKNNLPYVVLTYRGLYLFDCRTDAPLASHIRSDLSIEQHGSNVNVQISPNGHIISILTSGNDILVYSIKVSAGIEDEVLTVFNKDGKIIQNGLPIISSDYKDTGYLVSSGLGDESGTGSSSKLGKTRGGSVNGINSDNDGEFDSANGIVNQFMSVLFVSDSKETPNYDVGLRLKLIINVQSKIVDYCFLNNGQLLLTHSKPHAFQVIHLNSPKQANDTKGLHFIMFDELPWFSQSNSELVPIKQVYYNIQMDCFVWISELGKCWLVSKVKDDSGKLEFKGKVIYDEGAENRELQAATCLINYHKKLCYIGLGNGSLIIFKLNRDLTVTRLKTIKFHNNSKGLHKLILGPNGETFIAIYQKSWNLYSFLGNLNFSTLNYDFKDWMKVTDINFSDWSTLTLTTSHKIFKIDLVTLNHSLQLNSVSFKRPVLIQKDKIAIFKAYEKRNIGEVSNTDDQQSESNMWLFQLLPVTFRLANTEVRSCSVSDDGNYACIVGNQDVIIYDLFINQYKFLKRSELGGGNMNTEDVSISPIRSCIWWKSHLILILKTIDKDAIKSEIIVFSSKILDKYESFQFDHVIWSFNFEETGQNENYLSMNLDSFEDELIVITDQLNCYTWKLRYEARKIGGTSLVFKKSQSFPFRNCFPKKMDDSILLNFKTILKVTGDDYLLLTNSDLFYIKKDKEDNNSVYQTYKLSESVEYAQKLTPNLIAVFDGSQMLHYIISEDEKNLMKIRPFKIHVGNEIVSDNPGNYLVDSVGTSSYPLTTVEEKKVIFGIEIDYSNSNLRFEATKKNYLNDLIHHYIQLNIDNVQKDVAEEALSIITVYRRFHRFKTFKFVLELLLMNYIQKCYDDKNYDTNNEYFNRLIELIKMTSQQYSIIMNCIKKIEVHYWDIFFNKFGQSPRETLDKLFNHYKDYQLSAHYFIIMLNYEKIEKLSEDDVKLINEILLKLVLVKDYETSFELVRFIKIVDDQVCNTIVENLKTGLAEYPN